MISFTPYFEILNPYELIFTKLANAQQHHILGSFAEFCTWAAQLEICSRPTVKYDFHTARVYGSTVIKKIVLTSHIPTFIKVGNNGVDVDKVKSILLSKQYLSMHRLSKIPQLSKEITRKYLYT